MEVSLRVQDRTAHRSVCLSKERLRVHRIKPRWVWRFSEESLIHRLLKGRVLHVCCGRSQVGDIRVDLDPDLRPDVVADMFYLPFRRGFFDTAVMDPPWEQWDLRYLYELRDVANRVILVHMTVPRFKGMRLLECWIVTRLNMLAKIVSVWEKADSELVSG